CRDCFFFSSRRRHTRSKRDWSSDVCSSDLIDLDDDGLCTITKTLTTMGCPLAAHIEQDVRRALADIPEVKDVDVNIVWDPPWGPDKMSRYAKIALGVPDF